MRRLWVRRAIASTATLLFLCLLAAGNTPVARAATITVNSTADTTVNGDGVCTLREAIINANNDAATWSDCPAGNGVDAIHITATGTLTLASALPNLTRGLTINGPGALNLTISGGGTYRVFYVQGTGPFSFSDLTIANASAPGSWGGGIWIAAATNGMSVNRMTFSANQASAGGAIYNAGGHPLTVMNSTFVNNTGYGGAILNDGSATLIVTNSTFSGNAGGGHFGGSIAQIGNSGSTTLTNVTINSSDADGAIYLGQGALTMRNSTVRNTGGESCKLAASYTVTNGGNNIDSGTTCGWGSASGSMSNTNPLLATLASNGGPTQTFALLAGSPAINAGNGDLCAAVVGAPDYGAGGLDQRGLSRRNGFCDIGAFEAQPASLAVASGSSPQSTTISSAFPQPLKINVKDNHSNPLGGVDVEYTAPTSGASAVLSSSTATSNSSGDASVTATANGTGGGPYDVMAMVTGVPSVTFSLTNNPYSTTTTISSHMPNPSRPGQPVTVAFTVTSTNGTPTGGVTVSNGMVHCTATAAAGSCVLTLASPGDNTLTAAFAGNSNFGPSTSPGVTHTVTNWSLYLPLLMR